MTAKSKVKQPKMVYIEWVDSKGIGSEWEFTDNLESMPPCDCFSIGYLLEKTDQFVTVCQSWSTDQVLGRMTIPKCAIKKMRTLK